MNTEYSNLDNFVSTDFDILNDIDSDFNPSNFQNMKLLKFGPFIFYSNLHVPLGLVSFILTMSEVS